MTELDTEVREAILWLAPRVRVLAVESPEADENMYLLDLNRVCFITTYSDSDREDEQMIVTFDGHRYYTARTMDELEELVAEGNRRLMRSSRFYIINLARVTGYRITEARDLFFTGLEGPVENAVTDTHLEEFNARLGL